MPIPLEAIEIVENEIERLQEQRSVTPPEQDFSFLNLTKRTVCYDMELIGCQQRQLSVDQILRRRYIAHWSLPGKSNNRLETYFNRFSYVCLF